MTEAERLAIFLYKCTFRFSNEAQFQDMTEGYLRANGWAFEREKRLGRHDRVDFLVHGGIALELKLKQQKLTVYRQLERYAEHDEVKAIILFTRQAMALPSTINGKPAYLVNLTRSFL